MHTDPAVINETTAKLAEQVDELAKRIEQLLETVPSGRKRISIMRALLCTQDAATMLHHSRTL